MGNIIKLRNVSKFYYSKGVIASGFNKINLDFKLGEFVAITGESGSGKSTLLNVISGLDSYEEGEMYINGEETSHYTEKDFEDYRRKYIGNIFQNFNLVNSYTVYQNIELVLLLSGNKKKDVKKKVLDLIKTVDLYRFRNTKVSKLSGGQKQRVAIARALAKDTPIIIADEPTGNLDARSAASIIKLLSEISKDKLVIIVTHNYEQVEKYVTRKIKMHDGKVLEDKEIKKIEELTAIKEANYKKITFLNQLRLGFRNAFNIIPKFLLVFLVYLFVTISLIVEYASFKEAKHLAEIDGYNYYFVNSDYNRLILKKTNGEAFNDEDYEKLAKTNNIASVYENDLFLDTTLTLSDSYEFWMHGSLLNYSSLDSVDLGRLPEKENEIVIKGNEYDYYIGTKGEELINKELSFSDISTGEIDNNNKVIVVGIKYNSDSDGYDTKFYVSDSITERLEYQVNQSYSNIKVKFMDIYYDSNFYNSNFGITKSDRVPVGKAYMTEDNSYLCPNVNCLNQNILISASNLYYETDISLTIDKVYNNKNANELLGINANDYDMYNGRVYINPSDYDNLFNKGNFQASVFADDEKLIDNTKSELEDMGYTVYAMKDMLAKENLKEIIQLLSTIVTIILVVALFFITYFVIRIILKSRNVYFSTIRMLGATRKISKNLLIIELLFVSNLAYFGFLLFIYLNAIGLLHINFVNTILEFLKINDYIVLYIILIILSYLVSQKFAQKLFKNSAMTTIREEV